MQVNTSATRAHFGSSGGGGGSGESGARKWGLVSSKSTIWCMHGERIGTRTPHHSTPTLLLTKHQAHQTPRGQTDNLGTQVLYCDGCKF
jgi:hypothetical protein